MTVYIVFADYGEAQGKSRWEVAGVFPSYEMADAFQDASKLSTSMEAHDVTGAADRPVPRCDQCLFWLRNGHDFGLCRMSSIDETFADLPPVEERRLTGRDLRAITTRQDFGCVQWEQKAGG